MHLIYSRHAFKAFALSVALGCLPIAVRAQSPGASAPSAKPIMSMGIKAVVTNITKSDHGFSVQMEIENLRKDTIFIAPVTSRFPGGGNTALTASGKQFVISNNGQGLVGMDPCYNGAQNFAGTITFCIKSMAVENMTAIEASQTAVLGATFEGPGDPGDYASFALKFIVRDAPSHAEGLGLKGGGSKTEEAGPPSIVSLSFPMLAFQDTK